MLSVVAPNNKSVMWKIMKEFIKILRPNGTQHNDIQHDDTQHNDIQHDDTQHNGLIYDTQHNRLSITISTINSIEHHYAMSLC
jgi:hypothetical protein